MPFSHSPPPPVLYFATTSYASLQILGTSKKFSWLEDCFPQFFALLRRLRHVYLGLQSFLRNYPGSRTKTSQFSHLDNISPRLSVFRHFQEGFERRPQRKTYQNMVDGSMCSFEHGSSLLQSSQFAA